MFNRHAKSVQDSKQYLGLRSVCLAGAVEVFEQDPSVGREATQGAWDLRGVRHELIQSDQVMRPGTYGFSSTALEGRTRATSLATSAPASGDSRAR